MPYYDIEIKQLITDKTEDFEVVFDVGKEDEFTEPVVFFALCVLREKNCVGEEANSLDEYYDAILPVLFSDEDGGLEVEILSSYKYSGSQEVRLRKKKI